MKTSDRPMIIKHREFNLFWNRRDGWVHYDYAERFKAKDVERIWIPREHETPGDSATDLVEAGFWMADSELVKFSIRLEDVIIELKREMVDLSFAIMILKEKFDEAKKGRRDS